MIVSLKDCQQYHSNCVSKSCLRFSLLYIIFSAQKSLVLLVRKFFLSFLSTGNSIFPFFLLKFFSYSYRYVTFFSQLCSPYQCIYNYAIYCYCIHAYFYTLFGLLPPRQSVHLQHPLGSHVLSSVIKYIELKHVRNS